MNKHDGSALPTVERDGGSTSTHRRYATIRTVGQDFLAVSALKRINQ